MAKIRLSRIISRRGEDARRRSVSDSFNGERGASWSRVSPFSMVDVSFDLDMQVLRCESASTFERRPPRVTRM
jgi:hypothetical protein